MKYLFGILVILIIFLATTVAYLAGKQNLTPSSLFKPTSSPSTSPTSPPGVCTMDGKLCEDGSTVERVGPNCEFAPCPSSSAKASQTISGGGILNFPRYEILIPSNWTHARESQTADDERLTLSSGPYKITLQQGGFGGAMCLYPGDVDVAGPAGRYSKYVDIITRSGDKLRRSTPESGTGFAICQNTEYGWGAPTLYGHISLSTPPSPLPTELEELDQILKSLKKI